MKTKIKIVSVNGGIFEYSATLSNGDCVSRKISNNPSAFDQFVSDIARITGQTDRGVKMSLRRWVS